jgi:MFS family permease
MPFSKFDRYVYSKTEELYLSSIFFFFGLSIMSLAARTPDIKANLQVNNGTFGTILSTGSLGAIVALLVGGQLVHKFGSKLSMQVCATAIMICFFMFAHTHNPAIYVLFNIISGASISGYHIASSGHALHRQDDLGKTIVPKLHGVWAVGATTTSLISFFLAGRVSVAVHISTLVIVVWLLQMNSISKLTPTYYPPSADDDKYELTSIKNFKLKFNFMLSAAFLSASLMEFISADWATLFGKEELAMSASLSTINYISILSGMIVGRFAYGWALSKASEQFLIRWCGFFGGIFFILFLTLSKFVFESGSWPAFISSYFAFFMGGLGTSFMAPIFNGIAGRLFSGSNAIAVAQLSLINTVGILLFKAVVAWVAQLTSIFVALLIPATTMVLLIYFGKIGNSERTSVSA